MHFLVIHPKDNVGVALKDMKKHDTGCGVELRKAIPFGFKMALQDIPEGTEILKYGEPIGLATRDIPAGDLVHVHNMRSIRAQGDV